MAETAAGSSTAVQHDEQQLISQVGSSKDAMTCKHEQGQECLEEQPQASLVQQHIQQLCSSIEELNNTTDLLVQHVQQHHNQQEQRLQHVQQDSLQPLDLSNIQRDSDSPGCCASSSSSSQAVDELQQQLSALLAEKQRIEADRQEMALQQGKYKGTIAQLEGALAFSERKVKDQLASIDTLQAQVSSLTAELQHAQGAAAQTPERCKTAAKALQQEAERATMFAQNNEAQVKKLRNIVQLEARQLSELLDFAEQERTTLLDREASLQQELEQLRSRAVAAESGASDALAESAALEQQLQATKEQLASCQARVEQLEGMLADNEARMQQAHEAAEVLTAERDAAARNLLRAEAELNDVSEYSTKMFRQVRFISHVLDKNAAVLGKLPEFANLTRDLRSFVAANARTWEPRNCSTVPARAQTAAAPTASNADTTASGMRDVAGKA